MSTATLPATTASDDAPVAERPAADRIPRESDLVHTKAGRAALAALRLATGWIFLWAFLDKTFGLGFSTPIDRAWVNGGTPSQGFLLGDSVVGPLKPFFAAIASPASDVLFMAGMLGIGAAVMLGIGLRISAVAGTVILVLMYLAEWPFIADSGSTNPAVDYHIIYALALIVIATLGAGDTFGFGRPWKHLVRRAPWLA